MRRSAPFLIGFATAMLCVVLAFVAAFLSFPHLDWSRVNDYRRIPNIRRAPPEARTDIVEGNLRAFKPTRPVKILVIGDSQTFGNEAPPEQVFSSVLSKQCSRYDLLNASIVDGRFDDQVRLLRMVRPHEFDLIITDINPAHFSEVIKELPRHLPERQAVSLASVVNMPDKTFYLKINLGMDIWDADAKISGRYNIGVKHDYYSHLDFNRRRADFAKMASEIQQRAKHSLFFISPNLASRYGKEPFASGWNMAAFRQQASEQCKLLANGGVCLDMTDSIERSGFFDIVHLNAHGHVLLANILRREIERIVPNGQCH